MCDGLVLAAGRVAEQDALLLVFMLPALEASAFVGFIVPGEIGVLLGGVLANQHKVALWQVLVAGIAGAIIGDSIGYEVGKRYGDRLLTKIPNRILKPEHLTRAEETIRHYGGKAVFVGRFTAALRVLIPGLAGMSNVPYRKFLAWNAAGGALWAGGFVCVAPTTRALGQGGHVRLRWSLAKAPSQIGRRPSVRVRDTEQQSGTVRSPAPAVVNL